MTLRLPLLPPTLALLVVAAAPAAGAVQEETPAVELPADDPLAPLARFREYLAGSPYHGSVFDGLYSKAVESGLLGALIDDCERAVESDPDSESARVLLARLYARTDRGTRALELLDTVPPSARGCLLAARLHAAAGARELATEHCDEGLALTEELELSRELALLRAELAVERGADKETFRAFRAVADLEPESFGAQLDVARRMAAAGVVQGAIAQLVRTDKLADGDASRRCQVLAELGGLYELRSDGARALEAYHEALPLMSRGNWLKVELFERVLDLHSRDGTLDALVRDLDRASDADPSDADAREFLAAALDLAGRSGEAARVLERATKDFPTDERMSARKRDLLSRLGDSEGLLREQQRLVAARPGDLELAFGLAEVLAERGEADAAARRLESLLANRPRDADLRARAAALHTRLGRDDDALYLLEEAARLEPDDARRRLDVFALHREHGRDDGARAVLVEAATREWPVDDLLAFADAREALGDIEAALALTSEAARAAPERPMILSLRADLEESLGRRDVALATLSDLARRAGDTALRVSAIGRIVGLVGEEEGGLGALAERARAAAASPAAEPVDHQLLAYALFRLGDGAGSLAALEALVAGWPSDVTGRRALADHLSEVGETERALAEYYRLGEIDPARRFAYQFAKARLLDQGDDSDGSLAALDAILAEAPRSAAVLKQLGDAYRLRKEPDRAVDAYERALRVQPGDGPTALALAEMYFWTAEIDRAREMLLVAWRSDDPGASREAVRRFREVLKDLDNLSGTMVDLHFRSESNPYDREAPRLLLELLLLEEDHGAARLVLDRLIATSRNDRELLVRRAYVNTLEGDIEAALADLEAAGGAPTEAGDELVMNIVNACLRGRAYEHAVAVGVHHSRPVTIARRLLGAGRADLAADFVRAHVEVEALATNDGMVLLADLFEHGGEDDFVLAVLSLYENKSGSDWRAVERIGDLYHQMGRRPLVTECGRRMQELGAPPEALESYFVQKVMREEYVTIRCEHLLSRPLEADGLTAALGAFLSERYDAPGGIRLIRDLLAAAESEGRLPDGVDAATWRETLTSFLLSFYRRNNRLVADRLDQLQGELSREGRLPETGWIELLWLIDFPGAAEYGSMWRNRPVDVDTSRRAAPPARMALDVAPGSPPLLAAVARRLERDGDGEEALEVHALLVQALATGRHSERLAAVAARAFDAHVTAVEAQASSSGSPQIPAALARRVAAAGFRAGSGSPTEIDLVPTLREARLHHGLLVGALGRRGEAARVIAENEPDDDRLHDWLDIAEGWIGIDDADAARAILSRTRAHRIALAATESGAMGERVHADWRESFDERWLRLYAAVHVRGALARL